MKNKTINNSIKRIYLLAAVVFSFSFIYTINIVSAEESAEAAGVTPERVIILVNKERDGVALPDLKVDDQLSQAARDKVEDMFKNQYFQHTSPDGVTPWYWMDKNEYNYEAAGENLAISFNDAYNQHYSWMKSDRHRKNILSNQYRDIGVAVASGIYQGEQTTITVQMFGTKQPEVGLVQQKTEDVSGIITEIDTKLQDFEVAVTNKHMYKVYQNIEVLRRQAVYRECAWICIAIISGCVFLIDTILIFRLGKVTVQRKQ